SLSLTGKKVDYSIHNYPTHGSNEHRVEEFVAYLQSQNCPNIVIIAHSMGGLLSVDAARKLRNLRQADRKVNICGILAFDSPYFGVNPSVVGNQTEKVLKTVSSFGSMFQSAGKLRDEPIKPASSYGKAAVGGIFAVAAVAAFATAYQSSPAVRSLANNAVNTVAQHSEFLGPLWMIDGQFQRMNELKVMIANGFIFSGIYLRRLGGSETFIILPNEPYISLFRAIEFDVTDPVDAHTHMFDDLKFTKSYFELLDESVSFCTKAYSTFKTQF
ncbi:hypothetical protein HK096_009525, partial [Nowakowskiella sp. JEL0078]